MLTSVGAVRYDGHQNAAGNRLVQATRKAEGDRVRTTDKSDRATTELVCAASWLLSWLTVRQVLDPRTRMILFKMLTRGFITEIDGCISTGKEANVYHAVREDGQCTPIHWPRG